MIIPGVPQRCPRRLPNDHESAAFVDRIMDAHATDERARTRPPAWLDAFPPPPSEAPRKRRSKDALLNDPTSDVLIDFNSEEGFYEAAKKKKGKQQQQAPPPPPPPPSKPADDPPKDDGAGGDDAKGGDASGGAGGGDGDGNNGGGLPDIPTDDFNAESFQDIKLGDDTGGRLDLDLGPPDAKGSFGSWGTKWNIGGGGGGGDGGGGAEWDFSGSGGGNDAIAAAADTKAEDNPWGKKASGKSPLGAFEESADNPTSKQGQEDSWGFGSKKEKAKTNLWGAEPEDDKKEGDLWGWGTSKKPAMKKGSLLEEITMDSVPEPSSEKKDIWDTWGISKKDREKKKNIHDESAIPEPAPDPPSAGDDLWGGWGSKKTGKKAAGWGATDEVPMLAPDPPTMDDKDGDDFWSTFGSGSKAVEEKPAAGGWFSRGLSRKGKKKLSLSSLQGP